MDKELCVWCEEETGKAGKYDDSIFCAYCADGPLCEGCANTDGWDWFCPQHWEEE